ncbi:MAG: DUF1987 domain-containing protein [Bacteroidales bacterium]|jgi:hypothetical protein|nr:DUF1987 domain-containing protein [Bacteroidales bacterium]
MENITLKSSPDTPYFPEVYFDADAGTCEISGESYMEETYKFYLPLITWIKQYIKNKNQKLELVIKLIYLNTSSTKCILDMLEVMKEYEDQGGDVKVIWYYDTNDPDMVDEVEDFEVESGIKIELREFES